MMEEKGRKEAAGEPVGGVGNAKQKPKQKVKVEVEARSRKRSTSTVWRFATKTADETTRRERQKQTPGQAGSWAVLLHFSCSLDSHAPAG